MKQAAHILIISNNTNELAPMVQYLKDQGYGVSPPVSSLKFESISKYVSQEEIDVILIDANYPSGEIFAFLKRLHATDSAACVLLIGSNPKVEKDPAFLRAGVFGFIKNPLSLKRLDKTIRQGLKNRLKLLKVLHLSANLERAYERLAVDKERLQKWNDDLSRLHALNQALSESLNIEEIVQSLAVKLKRIVKYDIAALFLKSEGTARIYADQNQSGPDLDRISVETLQSGQVFLKTERFLSGALVLKEGSEIMIPLMVGAEKIGLLRLIRSPQDGKLDVKEAFDNYQSEILSMVSLSLAMAIRNAEMYRQVQDLAIKDELTSVLNRRAFSNALDREFKRANRWGSPLSLLLVDIDHFKKVNDHYGHLAGDQALREVALILKKSIREVDVLARYGGEEFVIILPDTNLDEVLGVAQRIKEKVQTRVFNRKGEPVQITVSMGVARCPAPDIKTPETLFHLADQALYIAKKKGRNRIVTLHPTGDLEAEALTRNGR